MSKAGQPCRSTEPTTDSGFGYIEILVAMALMFVTMLALAGLFLTGYAHVDTAGKTTMGLSAARQILEDARKLPYDNLVNLHGFDTEDPSTVPGTDPEREIARRWRYALAGEGVGWSFTAEERSRWPRLSEPGDALRAAGKIEAVQLTGTMTEITVIIFVPGRWRPIQVATRIARSSA